MFWRKSFCLLLLFCAAACGSESDPFDFDPSVSTQALPYVNRVEPTSGQAGDTVTIFGFGFSVAPANNTINIGKRSAIAATYALKDPPSTGEIETLTVTIPSGAETGAAPVFVTVFDWTSNSDIQLTVNP